MRIIEEELTFDELRSVLANGVGVSEGQLPTGLACRLVLSKAKLGRTIG